MESQTPLRGNAEPGRARFLQLVAQCEAAMMRAALRLCRGGHDCAQDLVQDALVKAYEAFRQGRFREGHSAQAWFLRILTNGFLNEYRRKSRWDAGVDVDTLTSGGEAGPPATHAARADMPGAVLLDQTLDEPLERALAALPEGLRLVVMYVDIEGMSYEETALALSIPVGTVRSRLSRARFALQKSLQSYGKERGLI